MCSLSDGFKYGLCNGCFEHMAGGLLFIALVNNDSCLNKYGRGFFCFQHPQLIKLVDSQFA